MLAFTISKMNAAKTVGCALTKTRMGYPRLLLPTIFVVGFMSGVCAEVEKGQDKVVVCYFTNWSQYRPGVGRFTTANVDPKLCTHLFFAFAQINQTGNTIRPMEWNYATKLHPGILKLKAANPDLRLVLSVGGFNADPSGWTSVSSTTERADLFSANVVRYLRKNRFEGLSIDWETPLAATQSTYFRLMKSLRSAIDAEHVKDSAHRLLLCTDVTANRHKVQYYSPHELHRLVDFIVLMAYDFYGSWSSTLGHHSPLFLQTSEPADSINSQHQAVKTWRLSGVPLSKLILGLAAYGRALRMSSLDLHNPGDPFTGHYPDPAPFTGEKGVYSYYEACNLRKQAGCTERLMPESRVPYVYGTVNKQLLWLGYDDRRSITEKTVYAVSRGMAGVMLWALDLDDFTGTVCGQGHKYPLLRAINEVFDRTPRCSSDKDCELDGAIKGVCHAGFCGCVQGSFFATKHFCGTDETLTGVTPASQTLTTLPLSLMGDAGSHAERLGSLLWLITGLWCVVAYLVLGPLPLQ